jgi:hypothetical protein
MMVIAFVDWDALLTVVWVSLLAGIGLTAAYGFAILGGTRALEFGRERRVGEAAIYGVIGAVGLGAVLAAIVYGIVILTNK